MKVYYAPLNTPEMVDGDLVIRNCKTETVNNGTCLVGPENCPQNIEYKGCMHLLKIMQDKCNAGEYN